MMRETNKKNVIVLLIILTMIMVMISSCKEESIQHFTLSNGLEVLVKNTSKAVSVLHICLKGGVTLIPEDKAGLEILLLTTMSRASERYDRRKMEQAIDDLHFTIEYEANFDFSEYKLKAINKYFQPALDVFLDTFLKPSLNEQDFEKARQIQLNKILENERDPVLNLFDRIIRVSFKGHPYAQRPEGTEESLQSLSVDEIKKFYDQQWIASRMFIVYVGDVPVKQLKDILERKLGTLKTGSFTMAEIPSFDKILNTSFKGFELPGLQNYHVRSNFPSVSYTHPDYFAAKVAELIMSDMMITTIRTWNAMAYTPYTVGTRPFLAPYGSNIIIGCSDVPASIGFVKECIDHISEGTGRIEYRDLQGNIITDKAQQTPDRFVKIPLAQVLPMYKNMLITSFFNGLASSDAQAYSIAMAKIQNLTLKDYTYFLEKIETVTPEQVQNIVKTYFKENVFWSYGSSKENIEKLSDVNFNEIWFN